MGSGDEIEKIKDLPTSLIDEVCDRLSNYVVGLSLIKLDGNNETLTFIGTGTLLKIKNWYCILTANHVLGLITKDGKLGIMVSFKGDLKRLILDIENLNICTIAKGDDDSKGPDIGIIILPDTEIGYIKSEKVFFNIDKRREKIILEPPEIDTGAWFILGIPGETEEILKPEKGYKVIKGYQSLCGTGGIDEEYQIDNFDYIEMTVEYDLDPTNLPDSFGGLSGSGVWQILLKKEPDGEISVSEYILSGVVFYQSSLENNIRVLKCHGRKSVYQQVYDFVSKIGDS